VFGGEEVIGGDAGGWRRAKKKVKGDGEVRLGKGKKKGGEQKV